MDAEERYFNYALLQHNGRQHVKFKSDIHKNYTTGGEIYQKIWQNTKYDKVYRKDKECYNCHKKGHPYSHWYHKKKKKDDDDKSKSSK